MLDPQAEETQMRRCGNRTHGGEMETKSVADKSEGIRRCGVAATGCSKEVDARSGPEAGWSTVLRNCEKNIPLTSFVPYTQRLSMLPDHVASHPLDILTDPGRKTPNSHLDFSETFKAQHFPEVQSESTGHPARPLVQLSLSSDSETVKASSRTSSESNLQSFNERVSIVDLLPPSDLQSRDIHGLLSTHFLPKRPLSQICSRTINASHIWKMGSTPAEGLPHYHVPNSTCGTPGNQWKSACNISAQIQAARSCSQRGVSPLPSNGTAERHEVRPFPGPLDLSSAGSSGLASSTSISAISQVSSSLEFSPTHRVPSGAANSTQMENGPRSRLSSFDRDFHLSTTSSRSRSSSFVSSLEEKQAVEIRKLRHELELANEKIKSLMTQVNMNVVLATTYEQNLESMSQRHQHLAKLLEEKSLELQKFRSSVINFSSCDGDMKSVPNSVNLQSSRRMSSSVCNFPTDSKATEASFSRQISSDSLNSESSSCSAASQPCISNGIVAAAKKKSKKNWIKKSLSRAFSGKHKHNPYLSVEVEVTSMDSSPSHSDAALEEKPSAPVRETDSSDGYNTTTRTLYKNTISDLKRQLSERDAEAMDLKLEALSSVQQMEQLRATVVQLKKEMASLKTEQMNLKRQVVTPGQSGPSSLTVDKAPHGNIIRKASIVSSADLAADPTTSTMSPDRSTDDGHPRLTLQESFIFSSPKFLHKFSLKPAITSVSIDDCFLPVKPSNAVTRSSSQRMCRKDNNRIHCHVDPKTTLSVDSHSPRCDFDFREGSSISSRKTLSPLTTTTPSPLSTSSDALRRNDANGCSKSRISTLLQSVV